MAQGARLCVLIFVEICEREARSEHPHMPRQNSPCRQLLGRFDECVPVPLRECDRNFSSISLCASTCQTVAATLFSLLEHAKCLLRQLLENSDLCAICPVLSVGDDNCSATLVVLDDCKVYDSTAFQLGEEPE